MELYQLLSFASVADFRNLTRAADKLCVSQSALSSQIKALEDELEVRLFTRTAKGMELTDNGRVLLTHAREVLKEAHLMKEKARAMHPAKTDSVTIGLNADPTFLKVSGINRRLGQLDRPLNVIFLTSQTVKTPEMLRKRTIDIGFFYGVSGEPDLDQAVVASVKIEVVMPLALAKGDSDPGFAEVAAMPWIWVESGCPFYETMGAMMEDRGLLPYKKVIAADEQVVKELVMAGQGVAMIREDEAAPLIAAGTTTVWPAGAQEIPLSLAWLKEDDGTKRLSGIAREIMTVFGVNER